jgi:hypothetical protein
VKFDLAPLELTLADFGPDLARAGQLELSGGFGRKGTYKVAGTVAPRPLAAELAIDANGST